MRILLAYAPADTASGLFSARRRRRSLDDFVARARRLASRLYPAVELTRTARWDHPDGSLLLLGLTDEPGEHWAVVDERRAVLWSGHAPTPPTAARPLDPGGHLLRFVGDADEGITVDVGVAGIQPCFHRTGPTGTVVSSRAPLAHLLAQADDRPRVDPLAASTLLTAGFPIAREHSLRHTEQLEPGEQLRLRPGAPPERRRTKVDRRPLGVEEAGAVLAERLTVMAASVPDGHVRAGATGGRDSRLVLAALHAAGRDFTGFTAGFPASADVRIGARVCALLGVDHEVLEPATTETAAGEVVEVDVAKRVVETLRATDGLSNGFENVVPMGPFEPLTMLGGTGGEHHRGGHDAGRPLDELDEREFKRYLRTRYNYKAHLLAEPAQDHVKARMVRWRRLAAKDPQAASDALYLTWRTGRWAAGTHLARVNARWIVLPLLDDIALASSYRVDFGARTQERLHQVALERLAPQLVDVPFDRRPWPSQGQGGLDGGPPPPPRFQWRVALDRGAREVFRAAVLDDGPDAPIWQVLDRKATLAHLAEDPDEYRLWWRLLTLKLTLDGWPWRDGGPDPAVIRIPVPASSR